MNLALVYSKTAKGVAEVAARSGALSLPMRRVLIIIDGKRAVAELAAVVRAGELEGILAALQSQGMIEGTALAAIPAPKTALVEDRSGEAATNNVVGSSPQSHGRRADDAMSQPAVAAPAAASAAQSSAASILPPALMGTTRPPTSNGAPRPPTLNGTPHPLTLNGTPRPPTLNGMPRPAEPSATPQPPAASGTPRPPALSGAPQAPANGAPRPATLNGASPPPTLNGARNLLDGGRPASDLSRRPGTLNGATASQIINPSGAADARPITLEESKRIAVRELYERLGPYGEEPAARIQGCTSVEALQAEIRHAGRRIATFRGEKAAQEYLHAHATGPA